MLVLPSLKPVVGTDCRHQFDSSIHSFTSTHLLLLLISDALTSSLLTLHTTVWRALVRVVVTQGFAAKAFWARDDANDCISVRLPYYEQLNHFLLNLQLGSEEFQGKFGLLYQHKSCFSKSCDFYELGRRSITSGVSQFVVCSWRKGLYI